MATARPTETGQTTAGQMLRRARLAHGWSQSRLEQASGVPQPVISAYESGRREPSVAALRRLAGVMGLDVALVSRVGRGPDPVAMARQLEDVLGLADAMHLRPPETPLRYPVLTRLS